MTFTADHLDLKPPGSVLDWHIFDDGFIAGDYRIRLLGPERWQVTCDEATVGEYRRLKTAFSTCEHHARDVLRRRAVVRHGVVAALAFVAWLLVDAAFGLTGIGYFALALFPVVFVGIRALVRCLASTAGNIDNPYLPRIGWDPVTGRKRRG